MKAWWQQQTPRDRNIIIWGGLLAGLLLLWALIWDPLSDSRASLRSGISEQRSTRLWLEQVEQLLLRQPNSQQQNTLQSFEGSLLRLVDDTVRAQGMAAAIERMEPDGPGQVRLWLRSAKFDEMVQWIENVSSRYGLTIDQAQISKDDTGRVNARLLINEPSTG
ncbi:MAG: type II secretion system protein M [Xanthomonadales bacterium]|nr:type II secretion system protein M [Xanthomonadales bacterium]